ncbi:MAG: hypothetical protein WD942_00110 [Dehalococcoidia bacterium]
MTIPTHVRGRFVRSVRLDASQADSLEGYLPTARALDVVRRVVRGMSERGGTRAFSITGPYGSGKSSLAVFLDALCGPQKGQAYREALDLLAEHDAETAESLPIARQQLGVPSTGMARAVITAPQREPVTTTVLRALGNATKTFRSTRDLRERVEAALERAIDDKLASPSFHEIRELVEGIVNSRPLLLVIDEFGKNLEAYSESGADGDLYLLQELAEWSSSSNGLPLVVVTIQHLAFEAYAASDSTSKRREWAKVQGRFEDIPFVDSAAATRNLIASALDHGDDAGFRAVRESLAEAAADQATASGLPEIATAELIAATWPLHPTTLIALPELCSRYGQNERTLFSFLASAEPQSVSSWLSTRESDTLDWVRLDRVYDYFIESAGNFLVVSDEGARWTEIATAIRDAHGLSDAQRRVLKAVGILNLVATAGSLRASKPLLAFACADGQDGTEDEHAVEERLGELEVLGLVTFRDYAQEYRIWRGSDFDINSALRAARRSAEQSSPAKLLTDVRPMRPVVAARHSTQTGTVRAFSRIYADSSQSHVTQPKPNSVCDGVLVYRLDSTEITVNEDSGAPVVVVDAPHLRDVRSSAVEVAALLDVTRDPSLPADDQAARRELAERTAYARLHLDRAVTQAFGTSATWTWINPTGQDEPVTGESEATSFLSDVLDEAYSAGPERVAYEAINRAELTSAGARARRIVQEAIVTLPNHGKVKLGLEGSGAEVAMYQAVIEDSGIHTGANLAPPDDGTGWRNVWDAVVAELAGEDNAVSAKHLLDVMMRAPYGLREGTASLVLTALLVVESRNLAVYEHGTFTPRITAPVAERLVRNPGNFAIKHLGTVRRGRRWAAIKQLHDAFDELSVGNRPEQITLIATVQRLADIYREGHSAYASKTRTFFGPEAPGAEESATAADVRDALLDAREPDTLLFQALPAALGLPPIKQGPGGLAKEKVPFFAAAVAEAMKLVATANDQLALEIFDRVSLTAVPRDVAGKPLDRQQRMHALEADAAVLAAVDTVSQEVRSFVQACLMNPSSPVELGTQIATTVTGVAPHDWVDRVIPRNLAQLEETAQSFRRVSDLNRARTSHRDGDRTFDAFAVTLTAADGRTVDTTVTLTSEQREKVFSVIGEALDAIDDLGPSAVDSLLAGLTAHRLDPGIRERTVDGEPHDRDNGVHLG